MILKNQQKAKKMPVPKKASSSTFPKFWTNYWLKVNFGCLNLAIITLIDKT